MLTILASAYGAGRLAALAVLALLLVALLRRVRSARRSPRSRLTDSIAACVVAVLLVTGVVRAANGGDSWNSTEGVEMRAGFIAGCESTAAGVVDCGCMFDTLVSAPAYDTPKELASLEETLQRAVRETTRARFRRSTRTPRSPAREPERHRGRRSARTAALVIVVPIARRGVKPADTGHRIAASPNLGVVDPRAIVPPQRAAASTRATRSCARLAALTSPPRTSTANA